VPIARVPHRLLAVVREFDVELSDGHTLHAYDTGSSILNQAPEALEWLHAPRGNSEGS
jgi:hypothetical protein